MSQAEDQKKDCGADKKPAEKPFVDKASLKQSMSDKCNAIVKNEIVKK